MKGKFTEQEEKDNSVLIFPPFEIYTEYRPNTHTHTLFLPYVR